MTKSVRHVATLLLLTAFLLVGLPLKTWAAGENMTLLREYFDGKNLVYEYQLDDGTTTDLYFKVPENKLEIVKNSSGNKEQEAKKQIMLAYVLFERTDRIGQLENRHLVEYNSNPKIDANFKIRFDNSIKEAKVYAEQEKVRANKSDYMLIGDDLEEITSGQEVTENGEAITPPSTDIEEGSSKTSLGPWIVIILITGMVVGTVVWVARKKGVK